MVGAAPGPPGSLLPKCGGNTHSRRVCGGRLAGAPWMTVGRDGVTKSSSLCSPAVGEGWQAAEAHLIVGDVRIMLCFTIG